MTCIYNTPVAETPGTTHPPIAEDKLSASAGSNRLWSGMSKLLNLNSRGWSWVGLELELELVERESNISNHSKPHYSITSICLGPKKLERSLKITFSAFQWFL